jgi:DNA repair exonuclease SbcCD ATPase subunit
MDMKKEIKDLENKKAKLEKLKDDVREAEAEKKVLLKQLISEWKCQDIEEAEEYLEELEEKQERLKKTFMEAKQILEETMEHEGLL